MNPELLLEEALEAVALAQENVEQAFMGMEAEGKVRATLIPQLEKIYNMIENLSLTN